MRKMINHYRLLWGTLLRVILQGLRYYFWKVVSWGKRMPISCFEWRIYSQNGEDGILRFIFSRVGVTDRYFVELGAGDGIQCNTRLLRRLGWNGIQVDAVENKGIEQHFISVDNVESILKNHNVPKHFDLLSIDIDGNDYWVWQAIRKYKPRVVVVEYNGGLGNVDRLVMPYNPDHQWDGIDFFGASLPALAALGEKKGYQLIGTDSMGINAFFVEKKFGSMFGEMLVEKMYHQPKYRGYPPSGRKFVVV